MDEDNSQTGLILTVAIGIAIMTACGVITMVMTGLAWLLF